MPELLYIDTSAFFDRLLAQNRHEEIAEATTRSLDAGGTVVSSRLLWLEAARVRTREALLGNDLGAPIAASLAAITRLPLTEEICQDAASIPVHVRTLDALHLATCRAAGATLLASDVLLTAAADSLGVPLAPTRR